MARFMHRQQGRKVCVGPLLEPVLKPLWEAYRAVSKARDHRAPLDLDLPERRVRIGEDGHVRNTRVISDSAHTPALTRCVQTSVQSWRYPRPEGGEVVHVEAGASATLDHPGHTTTLWVAHAEDRLVLDPTCAEGPDALGSDLEVALLLVADEP